MNRLTETLFLSIIFLWGTTWIAIKHQVGIVPVEVSVLYRFLLAAILMFCVLRVKKVPLKFSFQQHVYMALLGILLFSLNFVLFYQAAPFFSSGILAIIFSTSVMMVMLNNVLFFNQKVTLLAVAGSLLGSLGLCLVFLTELKAFELNAHTWAGIGLALGGTYCFSLANQVSLKCRTLEIPLLSASFFGMVYGVVFLIGYCLIKGSAFCVDWSLGYLGGLVYLAIPGSVFGHSIYLALVNQIGPQKAAYTTLFYPIVALCLATFFESFIWVIEDFIGILLILVGNALVLVKLEQWKALAKRLFKRRIRGLNASS